MLVSMKEMLADARAKHYALPAFDISNYDMMKSVLEACEEEHSPALLMALGVDLQGRDMNLIASMVRSASDYFHIPVCLHLDHATNMELIQKAVEAGFSSVMYDGSVLDFENNARNTAEVTKYAHAHGITVEAELGHVGNASVGSISETGNDTDPGESLTVPEEVAKFVDITHVDALAVAIGTAHGKYKGEPKLDFDRLAEIRKALEAAGVSIPLVLHGASGLTDESVRECIAQGICKVNFATELRQAYSAGVKEVLAKDPDVYDPKKYGKVAMAKVQALVEDRIKVCGCNGKA